MSSAIALPPQSVSGSNASLQLPRYWPPSAIKAAPWTDMSGFPWRGARFAEYRNTGPGAGQGTDRPQLTDDEAKRFTKRAYLGGWNPA